MSFCPSGNLTLANTTAYGNFKIFRFTMTPKNVDDKLKKYQ